MQYKKPEYCAMIEEYINSYRNRQGSAPSVREIAAGVGLAVSTVSKYLSYMRQNGVLDYDGHRSITTRKSRGLRNMLYVPLLGSVSCGIPKFAEENIEEYVCLPESLFGRGEFFLLRAWGDSMIGAGIEDGDLVLIRRQSTADYNQIVVALVEDEATLKRFRFVNGLYRTLSVPGALVRRITVKGMPLLLNEALWSLGMATLTQCYSLRGLHVVAAMNISTTVSNLFAATFLSMGSATAIIVGQSLGANDLEGAQKQAWKLIAFSLFLSVCGGILLAAASPFVPRLYRTEADVRTLATQLLTIYACCMPLFSYCNSAYFTLRSGGKTLVTFVFDSGYTWVVAVPLAWCLVHLTTLDIRPVYLIVQLADIIKVIFGHVLIKRGVWVNNIVGN